MDGRARGLRPRLVLLVPGLPARSRSHSVDAASLRDRKESIRGARCGRERAVRAWAAHTMAIRVITMPRNTHDCREKWSFLCGEVR